MNAKWLTTPKEKVQQLQEKLGHAAKTSKSRKFHALYDKVHRMDVMQEAWRKVRANKGAAGIDGETMADIAKIGEERFLAECQERLIKKSYHPQPVRRYYIPKKDGRKRPLGIPTVNSYCTPPNLFLDFNAKKFLSMFISFRQMPRLQHALS